jgi:hypothetical protein
VGKKSKADETNGAASTEAKPAARRARSTSSRKKSAKPRKPKATPVVPADDVRGPRTLSPAPAQPTDEEISIRAYFIAERRHRFDLPGDADSDWLEAKRQLLSELGPR